MPLTEGALGGWQSRTTFVLALSASAVGLGNFWRFAYLLGDNGGAPFLLTYLACLLLVAVPVLIAEIIIGSRGRGSPPVALRWSAKYSGRGRGWMLVGVLACITGIFVLSYYAVIGGWALAYADSMRRGVFAAASAMEAGSVLQDFLADPGAMAHWHLVFLGIVMAVLALGIQRGLAVLVWLAVPTLLVLIGVLLAFALEQGDTAAAKAFLFSFQALDFTPESVLLALGHAFYTLSVGVGIGITYGAYAPQRIPIARSVLAVAVFDTAIALAAGIAIFPIVFANNIEPSMGPGLLFVSVPYAFGNLGGGDLFGTLFFLMVAVAALGSAVALLEPAVGALIQYLRVGRSTAVVIAGTVTWLLGLAVIRSLAGGGDDSLDWFGLLEGLTSQLLLPLGALLVAVFVGWRMDRQLLQEELARESGLLFVVWRFVLRYVAAPAIIVVLVTNLTR